MKHIRLLNDLKFGLVLSGGGPRGAYEVGVASYLADVGFAPTVYAGASIGAINATVLAAAGDLAQGAEALRNFWLTLDYRQFFAPSFKDGGLLSSSSLSNLLREPLEQLGDKPSVWVSVYKSEGACRDILRYLGASIGFGDTDPPEFLRLQDLTASDRMIAVLASAALPGLYARQLLKEVEHLKGVRLSDGGWAARRESDGNTPFHALAREKEKCDAAVVVHLSDGSLWNRFRHANSKVIEVRPGLELHPSGEVWDGLDGVNLDPIRIREWIAQGFDDCERCVIPAISHLGDEIEMRSANNRRAEALAKMKSI